MITSDRKRISESEITIRIGMAKDAFGKRKELLAQKMNISLKKRMIDNNYYCLECGFVWGGDMEFKKGGYQAFGGFGDVAVEKIGESELGG